jgi:phosphoenolpyruvate synthase/pyruvate phosphate dikinase
LTKPKKKKNEKKKKKKKIEGRDPTCMLLKMNGPDLRASNLRQNVGMCSPATFTPFYKKLKKKKLVL